MLSFLLRTQGRGVAGEGIAEVPSGTDEAIRLLRRRRGPVIVGALPFHHGDAPALFAPETFRAAPPPRPGVPPRVTGWREIPDRNEHTRRVREAVDLIRDGYAEKLVLSRALVLDLESRPDPAALADAFAAGGGNAYLALLTPSGPESDAAHLVGSSPELLIRKRGSIISSHPLAGTAPRCADPVKDHARATELMLSQKDRAEHAVVTDAIKRALSPLCLELHVPDRPSLMKTEHTWHLGTPISGILRDPSCTSLELAELLHPTPAVGGHPAAEALRYLRKHEPDRGFYAGAVGWSRANGDGEWRVAIRGALLRGRRVTAHAGGGIVADSVPAAETAETTAKFGPVTDVFWLGPEWAAASATGEPATSGAAQ